mmetsp:Transcript_20269/g.49705  ORF Transcript_20269/g.49705 Transcript_20269/m.49705 type:complete len:82 (+) Transcript_20269:62-307(+)
MRISKILDTALLVDASLRLKVKHDDYFPSAPPLLRGSVSRWLQPLLDQSESPSFCHSRSTNIITSCSPKSTFEFGNNGFRP